MFGTARKGTISRMNISREKESIKIFVKVQNDSVEEFVRMTKNVVFFSISSCLKEKLHLYIILMTFYSFCGEVMPSVILKNHEAQLFRLPFTDTCAVCGCVHVCVYVRERDRQTNRINT